MYTYGWNRDTQPLTVYRVMIVVCTIGFVVEVAAYRQTGALWCDRH
jgi:hypothetical protein